MPEQLLRSRQLHEVLKELKPQAEVWFQPPTDKLMDYSNDVIIYQLDSANTKHADNLPYRVAKRYQVTVITLDPESKLPDLVATLPSCTLNSVFMTENLNHYVYTLYF